MMASCAIALGSNLGNSRQILQEALETLNTHKAIEVTACSQIYRTAPVGPPQPDYLNCCALLQTELSPEALLAVLLKTEVQFGRIRRERWGPRTLDLDLLLFDQLLFNAPELQFPHPRMHERAFVLIPLVEIAPDWVEPVSGKSVAALAAAVDPSGIYLHSR